MAKVTFYNMLHVNDGSLNYSFFVCECFAYQKMCVIYVMEYSTTSVADDEKKGDELLK